MKNIIPYNDTLELGRGFNSVRGEVRGSLFGPDLEFDDNKGARGQKVHFKMARIESSEQLYEELGISVDMTGRYGLFAASAKFQFAEQSSFNSYSVFYLLSVRVQNAVKRLRKYQLNPDVVQMLKDGDTEWFNRTVGDSFIDSVITGGEFFAIYEFVCTDESSKSQISAELEVEYGASMLGAGVEVNAKFNSFVARASQKSQLKLEIHLSGGIEQRVPANPQDLLEFAREFPKIVSGDKGVPYEVIFMSYETLPLPKGPNYIEMENKKFVLDNYAKDIIKWRKTLTELDYILDKPEEFELNPEVDMPIVVDQRLAVANIINDYTKHASTCADTPTACAIFNPKREDLEKINKSKLPARKKTLDYVVLYDGTNYTGNAHYLVKAEYLDGNVDLGVGNDKIKSIKIPQGWQVILFEHWYFNGRNLPLTESCPDLTVHNFSDMISSIFVGSPGETVTKKDPPSQPVQPAQPAPSSQGLKIHAYTKFRTKYLERVR